MVNSKSSKSIRKSGKSSESGKIVLPNQITSSIFNTPPRNEALASIQEYKSPEKTPETPETPENYVKDSPNTMMRTSLTQSTQQWKSLSSKTKKILDDLMN